MGRIYVGDNKNFVWQWQPNEQIVLEGYPDGVFVHYANCNTAEAPVVQSRRVGDKLIADIPPELMQEPHDITVYVCDADGTLHSYFIPVVERPKPESYIYEPVEILRYESLAKRIAALEEGGVGGVALDTTLTQSGKAADAKATGDEIKRVEGLVPSIDGLAKTEDIPTKPEDIGAQPKGDYLTKAPVESVNGKTGAVKLSASDVGALPNTYTPPDQTAEQVGADPAGTALTVVGEHNVDPDSHNDIRGALKALSDRLTEFFDSDDQTLDELSEIVAYIKSNKSLIDAITTSKVSVSDIVDNLATNVAGKPLSAAQGVAIKALIDGLSSGKLDADRLPDAVSAALAQAKESGEFDGPPGDDYVLTDADRQEIAEIAAGLVEVPEGGGGSAGWKRIGIFTAADNINPWIIDADEDGNKFSCTEFRICAKLCWFQNSANPSINRALVLLGDNKKEYEIHLSNISVGIFPVVKGDNVSSVAAKFNHPCVIDITTHCGFIVATICDESLNNEPGVVTGTAKRNRGLVHTAAAFTGLGLRLGWATNLVMPGSTLEIWGR